MADFEWVSENEDLPAVGQVVFLASPDQFAEFWRFDVAQLLVRHEGVYPTPVQAGCGTWPVDYYWCVRGQARATSLVTGNGWWAPMDRMSLPPRAEHKKERGYSFVEQVGPVFIPKDGPSSKGEKA
ncbi:MAG: hypothetical protein ACI807_003947 [Paracoccaceae bacterium]|jgi:hypothetical protein